MKRNGVLCLLQNQWFKDLERIQKVMKQYTDHKGEEKGRNRFIRDMLFMGCVTGKRIKEAFGEEFCWDSVIAERVTFEEVSPQIGGHASSVFPADLKHVHNALEIHKPGLIVTFGKVAQSAFVGRVFSWVKDNETVIVNAPHPAARGVDTMIQLKKAAKTVLKWMGKNE